MLMITLAFSLKQHLPKDMQHSVHKHSFGILRKMSRYVFLLSLLSIFLLTCAKTFKDRQGTKLVVVTGTNFFHQSGQDFPESEVIDLESDIDG